MLWWMLRPWNIAQSFAWAIGGAILGTQGHLPLGRTLVAMALVFIGNSTGQWANDMIDVEIDRVNNPQRPLPSGALSLREVGWAYVIANAFAVTIAWLMSPWAGLLALLSLPFPILYTKLKRQGILGTLTMGACCAAALGFGSLLVAGSIPEVVWWVMVGIVLFDINLNTMAACGDIEGDSRQGVRTLPVRIGARPALIVAILGQIASLVAAFGPYWRGLLGWQYLPLAVLVEVVALVAVIWLYQQPSDARVMIAGRWIKAAFLSHCLVFAAGYLPVLVVVLLIFALQAMTLLMLGVAARAGVLSL